MSKKVLDRLKAELGDKVLETSAFRGDEEAVVAPGDWVAAATLLRDDPALAMNHFIDLTAVDHPEREGARFDVVLFVRSMVHGHRVRLRTRVAEGAKLATLTGVWPGAGWAEREMWDMFGIELDGHPDLRRILLYEEFEGHPLRKDYDIARTQPLVPYRQVDGVDRLPPFGSDIGRPWSRVDWGQRLAGRDLHVSPAIAEQEGQLPARSAGTADVEAAFGGPEE